MVLLHWMLSSDNTILCFLYFDRPGTLKHYNSKIENQNLRYLGYTFNQHNISFILFTIQYRAKALFLMGCLYFCVLFVIVFLNLKYQLILYLMILEYLFSYFTITNNCYCYIPLHIYSFVVKLFTVNYSSFLQCLCSSAGYKNINILITFSLNLTNI